MYYLRNSILFLLFIFIQSTGFGKLNPKKPTTLTSDGAWCWFSSPRAIYTHQNKNEMVTGWVTADGSIEAASLNLKKGEVAIQRVAPQLNKDDHANPSFCELENGNVLMSFTKHSDTYVRNYQKKPTGNFEKLNFVAPFSEEQFALYPRKGVTYANPFSLKNENNRIFCFGRWTGFKPNLMYSDDGGKTYSPAKVFITNKPFSDNNRPYVIYYSDGISRIHIVFTDGHPRNEPTNSVYYAYYENEAFYRVDGSKICNLNEIPFEPKDASLVYKATPETGRAWVYDVTSDKKGMPVILYARYPKETEHLYHYTSFDGEKWVDYEVCNSGKWFPQTPEDKQEVEPHYSAGMTIHPLKPNTIYLSREINGVFELEKRMTKDQGKTWETTPITQNSKYDNVRPVVPKNMKKGDPVMLLWMENEKYIHYTDYKTNIKYYIDKK